MSIDFEIFQKLAQADSHLPPLGLEFFTIEENFLFLWEQVLRKVDGKELERS